MARREFMQLIVAQARQHRRTTLFSSHLIDEVERCADRVGIIHQGRMRFEGGLDELLALVRRVRLPAGVPFAWSADFELWRDEELDGVRMVTLRAEPDAWASLTPPPEATFDALSLEEISSPASAPRSWRTPGAACSPRSSASMPSRWPFSFWRCSSGCSASWEIQRCGAPVAAASKPCICCSAASCRSRVFVLGQVLIATEFRQRRVSSRRPSAATLADGVKFALGLTVLVASVAAALYVAWHQARGAEAMTPRFATVLAFKSAGWVWFFYTLCFVHSFLGRYRIPFLAWRFFAWLGLMSAGVQIAAFGPFALVDQRFLTSVSHPC